MTDPPDEHVYASVVTIKGLRICIFLAELNGLKIMAGDIGNAYLEAKTHLKICIIAGPEFGELAGTIFVGEQGPVWPENKRSSLPRAFCRLFAFHGLDAE